MLLGQFLKRLDDVDYEIYLHNKNLPMFPDELICRRIEDKETVYVDNLNDYLNNNISHITCNADGLIITIDTMKI